MLPKASGIFALASYWKAHEGAIRSCFPSAHPQRCLFHVLPLAGRWLREHVSDAGMPRGAIKGALCHIFPTGAGGRWARFRRFQPQALGWGVLKLAQEVGTSPPQVILAVGNRRIRHTNTAAARVFRAFNRVVRAWKEGQETHPNATWFSG